MIKPSQTQLKILARLACLGISILGIGLVLRQVDLATLWRVLAQAKFGWMLAGLAIFGAAFGLAAARWHLVLRLSQMSIHAGATGRTVLIGHLFNTILFGPTGGDIAKAALYSRWYGMATSGVLATCLLDRSLGGAGFFLFAGCTPGIALYGRNLGARIESLLWSPRIWLCGATLILLLLAARVLGRRFHWASLFSRFARAVMANSSALFRNPRLAVRGIGIAVVCHLCVSCVFLFSLKAVTHASFSLAAIFWVFPVISLITAAPVTFAGTGLREGASLFLLGMYGIPAADAVAAALLVLVTYLVWAVVGAFLLWQSEKDWEARQTKAQPRTISVIIPTLNEAQTLPSTIQHAKRLAEVCEIIVADGGSEDATRSIAEQLGCRVLLSPRGDGCQLRRGAAEARGDVVLLLQADTWLPADAGQAVLRCLRDPGVLGGACWKAFRERSLLMASARLNCALRLWLFGRVRGDQAIFIRREALEAVGGVPDVPLMEDFILSRRLRKLGRLALAGTTVTTSARRFVRLGIWRTYFRMGYVTVRYYLGASCSELHQIYERD